MKKIILHIGPAMARTALLEDGVVTEILIDQADRQSITGNIYAGRVADIVPGQFAFIDIGRGKKGFLQLDDPKQLRYMEENTIHKGKILLVQAVKDEDGDKGAALTTELSFAGQYMVLIAHRGGYEKRINISSKITDTKQRDFLTKLVAEGLRPQDGVILRTQSQRAEAADIKAEYEKLSKLRDDLLEKGQYAAPPAVLYQEDGFYTKSLKALLSLGVDEVVTNTSESLDKVKALAGGNTPVSLYQGGVNIFEAYGVESQIEKALKEKIWLKSGGFLLIEETHVGTVVDVNTGKFVTKKDKEKTVIKNNLEAADEIARQIRLRNLSGMILIDFVDMKEENNKKRLIAHLGKELKKDRVPAKIVGYSSLNLMELTRKKTRPSLSASLTMPCPACGGAGKVCTPEYLSQRIFDKAESILSQTIYNSITIEGGKKVINILEQSGAAKELEKRYHARIQMKTIETGLMDYYEITKEKL